MVYSVGRLISAFPPGTFATRRASPAKSRSIPAGTSWLALTLGLVILLAAEALAGPVAGALAGRPEVAHAATTWLRIAALGTPGLLLATAGNGWLRGVQDTRRPMIWPCSRMKGTSRERTSSTPRADGGLPGS